MDVDGGLERYGHCHSLCSRANSSASSSGARGALPTSLTLQPNSPNNCSLGPRLHLRVPPGCAEEEGFEPPVPLRVHLISNQAHSTTLPLLRKSPKAGFGESGRKSSRQQLTKHKNFVLRQLVESSRRNVVAVMDQPPAHITSTVTYEGGLRTVATHLASGQQIITDAPVDNHGKGEAFSPTDLAATSLASCILTTIAIMLEAREVDIVGATAEVVKVMAGPPRRISAVRIVLRLPAKPYTPQQRELIAKVVEACPVGRSLHPELEQDVQVVYAEEPAAAAA